MKNNFIKLTVFLALIAALATGILAVVNQTTSKVIADNAGAKATQAYKDLYPEAKKIEKVEFKADKDGIVKEAFKIDDTAYIFKAVVKGFGGDIEYILGYNNDGSNSKFKVISHKESPNYGQKIELDDYAKKFTGIKSTDETPVISGATVTSTAMKKATSAIVEVFNALSGNTGGPKQEAPKDNGLVYSNFKDGKVIDKKENGNLVTYVASGQGFEGTNKFEIVVDKSTNKIESVKIVEFAQSDEMGKPAQEQSYLDTFKGYDLKGDGKVDAASGATVDSQSLFAAINAVASDLGVKAESSEAKPAESVNGAFDTKEFKSDASKAEIVKEDGKKVTIVANGEGFEDDNKFEFVLDLATKKIESVKIVEFAQSDELGKPAQEQSYLDSFKGISFEGGSAKVDAASGATEDSKGIFRALDAAIRLAMTKIGG